MKNCDKIWMKFSFERVIIIIEKKRYKLLQG
jgi:hypothetical protein